MAQCVKQPWKQAARPCLRSALVVIFFHVTVSRLAAAEKAHTHPQSVPGLEAAMRWQVFGKPCVRLNTLWGPSGCGNPGREPVWAPLQRMASLDDPLTEQRVLLVPVSVFPQVLHLAAQDSSFRMLVAGVVVEGDDPQQDVREFSPAAAFPQEAFAPAHQRGYAWNRAGANVSGGAYDFPVMLLSKNSTLKLRELANHNAHRGFKHPLYVVELNMVMQTTRSGTTLSSQCLEQKTCLPLGGYSVLTALPRITPNATSPPSSPSSTSSWTSAAASASSSASVAVPPSKPIVLAVASLDAAAFFRDAAVGADSPLSGAIALLGAVDAISRTLSLSVVPNGPPGPALSFQVIFAFLTGESWGYLGSRSLVRELQEGGEATRGINVHAIKHVLELGSVGRAASSPSGSIITEEPSPAELFAHQTSAPTTSSKKGPGSSPALMAALEEAARSMGGSVSLKPASARSAGLPPSSLLVLNQELPQPSGVVLEEFDEHFKNPFYGSFLDNPENVGAESINRACTLAARALLILAGAPAPVAQETACNRTLVMELMACLLTRAPGLTCQLARGLITPAMPEASHYAGVLYSKPEAHPPAWAVSDTSRFVWNFVASRTGEAAASAEESRGHAHGHAGGGLPAGERTEERCSTSCKAPGDVCVGSTTEKKGVCLPSTTRYLASVSPRVIFDESGWHMRDPRPENSLDVVDPVWTESYWQELRCTAFLKDSLALQYFILGLGFLVFFLAVISARIGNKWATEQLKFD